MDGKNNLRENEKQEINRGYWIGNYIVGGLIFALARQANFAKTTGGEFVSTVVAIAAGLLYHKLKEKIKIKNETIRVVITFLILEIIAGAVVGFFTPFVNLFLNV